MNTQITLDASRALYNQPTGVEIYTREILYALIQLPESAKYSWNLLAPHKPALNDIFNKLPKHAQWEIVPGGRGWTLFALSKYFQDKENSKKTLFVPGYILPIICPQRSVFTIHDVAYRYYPESYGRLEAWRVDQQTARSANKASAIIVPTESTAQDVLKYYHVDRKKIFVIPHGINHATLSTEEEVTDLPTNPYFLTIGRVEPRKNSLRIAEAYQIALNKNPDLPDLLFIGKDGYHGERIRAQIERLPSVGQKIRFLGYQSQSAVKQLLSRATGLIFPSLYEGFGIPVLEAMVNGIPVITSNTGSLAEAAGKAALLVDPNKSEAISQSITELYENTKLRKNLIELGKERAKTYTWDNAARQTLKVLLG